MRAELWIARAVLRIVPSARAEWGCAMASEIAAIEGRGATRFAIGCLGAAVALRVEDVGRWMLGTDRPRTMAVIGGSAACLLGLVYLAATGAPASMLAVNATALLLGLLLVVTSRRVALPAWSAQVVAAGLMATVILGVTANGATRWVRVAGLAVQPSLVLLPAAIVLHVARRSALTTAAMVLAALALALQPDRGMAGPLLLALLAGGRRSGRIAPVAAALGFATTMVRPDASIAAAWVDGILHSAPRVGALAGMAVWLGVAAMLLPILVAVRTRRADVAAFAACWAGVVVAAVLGNYPTPLVGYGGSAILGYFLGIAALRPVTASDRIAERAEAAPVAGSDRLLRSA